MAPFAAAAILLSTAQSAMVPATPRPSWPSENKNRDDADFHFSAIPPVEFKDTIGVLNGPTRPDALPKFGYFPRPGQVYHAVHGPLHHKGEVNVDHYYEPNEDYYFSHGYSRSSGQDEANEYHDHYYPYDHHRHNHGDGTEKDTNVEGHRALDYPYPHDLHTYDWFSPSGTLLHHAQYVDRTSDHREVRNEAHNEETHRELYGPGALHVHTVDEYDGQGNLVRRKVANLAGGKPQEEHGEYAEIYGEDEAVVGERVEEKGAGEGKERGDQDHRNNSEEEGEQDVLVDDSVAA